MDNIAVLWLTAGFLLRDCIKKEMKANNKWEVVSYSIMQIAWAMSSAWVNTNLTAYFTEIHYLIVMVLIVPMIKRVFMAMNDSYGEFTKEGDGNFSG